MNFDKPKNPQEIDQIKKERVASDAELLENGAVLSVTDKQIESAKREMEEDLSKKDFEKKLENMTSEEREFYDQSMTYGNLLEENRVLLREGKIDQEQFSNIMKNIQDLGNSRNEALREKIGNKKVNEILDLSDDQLDAKNSKMMQSAESFEDLYKAMRRNYDMKFSDGTSKNPNYFVDVIEEVRKGQKEINWVTSAGELRKKVEYLLKNEEKETDRPERENGTIKKENKKEKFEEIFEEIIQNPKIRAVFVSETEDHSRLEKMHGFGSDEYKVDLKNKLESFLRRFSTKKDFDTKEKYGEDIDREIKRAEAEISSGRSVESNKNILKGLENRKEEERGKYGWEARFGESYNESLKEFSQLLYGRIEKYQKEKNQKTEKNISDAKSFDDLYKAVKISGGIQGSKEFFKPEALTDLIEKVRNGSKTIKAITSSFELQKKVEDLLKLEKIRKEIE